MKKMSDQIPNQLLFQKSFFKTLFFSMVGMGPTFIPFESLAQSPPQPQAAPTQNQTQPQMRKPLTEEQIKQLRLYRARQRQKQMQLQQQQVQGAQGTQGSVQKNEYPNLNQLVQPDIQNRNKNQGDTRTPNPTNARVPPKVQTPSPTSTSTSTSTKSAPPSSTSLNVDADSPYPAPVVKKRFLQRVRESNTYLIHFGGFSWLESSYIQRADSMKYQIRSTVYGAAFGFERITKDRGWFYNYSSAAILLGEATATNVMNDIEYNHRGIATLGLDYTFGVLFHPKSDKILIGFAVPIVARSMNFKISDPDYKFLNKFAVLPFVALEMNWQISENFAFVQKLGAPLLSDGTLWIANVSWIL